MKSRLLPLLLCLIFLESRAQPEQIRFKRLSIEDGLSQSTVRTILNDREGYMWFGTRDGLNRYDGNKITIFRHNPKIPTSISSSDINYIYEDQTGNLWICTTEGIDRFDRQREIFVHYKTSKDNISATSIIQDNRGELWLGSFQGLHKYNARENRFMLFEIQPITKVIYG
jgi:ligand-binding sensor domain-containing protein